MVGSSARPVTLTVTTASLVVVEADSSTFGIGSPAKVSRPLSSVKRLPSTSSRPQTRSKAPTGLTPRWSGSTRGRGRM